jgi:hypothetical protein
MYLTLIWKFNFADIPQQLAHYGLKVRNILQAAYRPSTHKGQRNAVTDMYIMSVSLYTVSID